jgi:beta-galactosidase
VISAIAVASADPAARVPTESAAIATADATAVGNTAFSLGETIYPVGAARREGQKLIWSVQVGLGGAHDFSIRYGNPGPEPAKLRLSILAFDGTVAGSGALELGLTSEASATLLDIGMNAGDYTVVLELPEKSDPEIKSLTVK